MASGVNERVVCNLLSLVIKDIAEIHGRIVVLKRQELSNWRQGYSVYGAVDFQNVRMVQKEGFSAKITARSVW